MAQEVLGVCRCFPRHHTSNAPRLFGPVRLLLLSPLRPAMPCRRLVGPLSFEKYRGTHSGNALYRHPEKGFALGRAVHTSSYNLLGTRKRCLTTQICLQAAVPKPPWRSSGEGAQKTCRCFTACWTFAMPDRAQSTMA